MCPGGRRTRAPRPWRPGRDASGASRRRRSRPAPGRGAVTRGRRRRRRARATSAEPGQLAADLGAEGGDRGRGRRSPSRPSPDPGCRAPGGGRRSAGLPAARPGPARSVPSWSRPSRGRTYTAAWRSSGTIQRSCGLARPSLVEEHRPVERGVRHRRAARAAARRRRARRSAARRPPPPRPAGRLGFGLRLPRRPGGVHRLGPQPVPPGGDRHQQLVELDGDLVERGARAVDDGHVG